VLAGSSANYVLRSMLPGKFLVEHILSKQEVAMAGLRLQVQMFLRAKGDKSNEGAPHVLQLGLCRPAVDA
jgi:hypothetical protein